MSLSYLRVSILLVAVISIILIIISKNNVRDVWIMYPLQREQNMEEKDTLGDIDDNLIGHFNDKCNLKSLNLSVQRFNINEIVILQTNDSNTDIGYIHVYKSGGTTIMTYLRQISKVYNLSIIKLRWNNQYNKQSNAEQFDQFKGYIDSSDVFLFTFIRDPIDHFLSGFTQAVFNKANYWNGYQYLRNLTYHQYRNQYFLQQLNKIYAKYQEHNSTYFDDPFYKIFPDIHIIPQIYFLFDKKWNKYNINYIGNLYDNTNEKIYQISKQFLGKIDGRFNKTVFDNLLGRNRNSRHHQFDIDKESLSDINITNLCKIYWLDYHCFPIFKLPKQCNSISFR